MLRPQEPEARLCLGLTLPSPAAVTPLSGWSLEVVSVLERLSLSGARLAWCHMAQASGGSLGAGPLPRALFSQVCSPCCQARSAHHAPAPATLAAVLAHSPPGSLALANSTVYLPQLIPHPTPHTPSVSWWFPLCPFDL